MVLWEPRHFAGLTHFVHEADKLIEYVRAIPRKPGFERIILPGDGSAETRTERLAHGIPLDQGTWAMLQQAAAVLDVSLPAENAK